MRIVSLVPAATAWLEAFGAGGQLLAAPEQAAPEALRRLAPDLVVAPDPDALSGLEGVAVVAFAPETFKQVLEAALRLGREAGRLPEAMRVVAEGERRLQTLHARLGRRRDGTLGGRAAPSAAVLEALAPPRLAGRWVPDLVEMAGGRPVGLEASPEVLVVLAEEALRERLGRERLGRERLGRERLGRERLGRERLGLVRAGRAFVSGRPRLFLQPGPGLYRAAEVLAAALHGARSGVALAPGELRPLAARGGAGEKEE